MIIPFFSGGGVHLSALQLNPQHPSKSVKELMLQGAKSCIVVSGRTFTMLMSLSHRWYRHPSQYSQTFEIAGERCYPNDKKKTSCRGLELPLCLERRTGVGLIPLHDSA